MLGGKECGALKSGTGRPGGVSPLIVSKLKGLFGRVEQDKQLKKEAETEVKSHPVQIKEQRHEQHTQMFFRIPFTTIIYSRNYHSGNP